MGNYQYEPTAMSDPFCPANTTSSHTPLMISWIDLLPQPGKRQYRMF